MENIITEDSIKLDGNTNDYKGKLKKRITDAIRLAKECKIAAKKARDDGNIVDAEWLEKRAEDYENAAKTWNQDALDDGDTSADSEQDNADKEPSQAEVAQDAANDAKRAARDAQDAANDAQNNAKKLADAGHDASAAQAAADKAQEKADEAKQAAEEAQEHADEASKAEAAGDNDKAKAEAEATEDAKKKAEQAASEANEAAEAANQKSASERAQDAAEAAEEAAKNAQTKADTAQKKADDLKAEDKDASEAQAEADKAKEKADEAKKAAEEAKDHAEKAEKAEKSGDMATANSEADKAEDAADDAKQAANSLSDGSEDSSGDSGDDSDSDGESSSDSGDDSDSDGESSGDSDNDSDSDGSSGSDSNSGDGSDSDGDSGDSSDSDYDDSDDDENQSDNIPVKDIFADEEDIPSMPNMSDMGQQGQKPRDPTVDEIVKQLSKLEGEARRGAIAGLTDLINKNKNESLAEAFSKGIREFSDKEWDDLNDETIDKINKIKQITTIDDVEGRKAKVKSWADNQFSRQELSDEESQNAQHDVLQRRAKEQELDKYNSLAGIKDFEIDFEGCIRDQVEMVMQDYLTYDEINPEYELEDVIMKAEVQRMMPDEAIPTIAVFFDKSGSCKYAMPTLNNAIATVKKKYVDTGMCKLDLYYFGDRVAYNDANAYVGGTTKAWPHIIDTIKKGDYNNVIVMSDADIENQNNNGESYTVTGCVWWLWVNGVRAKKCTKELRGMQHNFECEISAY